MRDRNVDRQCTVTWPVLASVASATAEELLVAMLNQPLVSDAPDPAPVWRGGGEAAAGVGTFSPHSGGGGGVPSSPLVSAPDQIRGSLVFYTMMTTAVPAFQLCTICLDTMDDLYSDGGFDFVCRTCDIDGPSYLDKILGLTVLQE